MRPLALFALCLAGCASSSADGGGPSDVDAGADGALDTTAAGDTAVDASDARADDVRPEAAADAATDASCRLHKPYSTKNAACNACAEASCCVTLNGCLDDPRCDDDYVNCILACALLPDDAGPDTGDAVGGCLADCAAKHPAGKAEYDAAIGCVDGACADACR